MLRQPFSPSHCCYYHASDPAPSPAPATSLNPPDATSEVDTQDMLDSLDISLQLSLSHDGYVRATALDEQEPSMATPTPGDSALKGPAPTNPDLADHIQDGSYHHVFRI